MRRELIIIMTNNIFCEYTIKSWEDCIKLFKNINKWVFRGQSNSSWSLQTSLQRAAIINDVDIRDIPKVEREIWRGLKDASSYGTRDYCNKILYEQTLSPLVMLIEPYNMHDRLSMQQGLFAVPFEGHQGFEYNLSLTVDRYRKELPKSKIIDEYENITTLLNEECALLKVKIPKEFHNEIRKELKLMNITSETLFPGIDGFAKSLNNVFY